MTNKIDLKLYLNDIANVLGNYEKTIEFYQKLLLDENFMDPSKFIILNMLIGHNYYYLFEYDNALFYYAIAFSLLDDRNKLISEVYHRIGDVWTSMNNFESALSCYEKAVQMLNSHHGHSRDFARIWRKIADLYGQQNNYKVANSYEEQAQKTDTFRS
jgi:tetratricopeptide (TPR) repeat protein